MHAKSKILTSGVCLCLALGFPLLHSCKDDYMYDDKEPNWLGANIYDYLSQSGRFTTYLALADDLDYKEVLLRTGSKTLFPADDEAFARYFAANGYSGRGADFVHGLSVPEKRRLFNGSMLNRTCLAYQLSDVSSSDNSTGEGLGLRGLMAASYLDAVEHQDAGQLPQTEWWARFEGERGGIWLSDMASRTALLLTPEFFATSGLTESDWNILTRGQNMPYDNSGFYINTSHVASANKDVTCKNGYLHIADEAVVSLDNMAEVIGKQAEFSIFSRLMDKYSAPYFIKIGNDMLKDDEAFKHIEDSIFVKRYFSDDDCTRDPYDKMDMSTNYGTLYFDPAMTSGSATDMPVMFVPTDEAMNRYWNSAEGKFLRDSYGTWDNVPTKVLASFMKNHQRRSFLSSLPHNWSIMTDETSYDMHVEAEDVVKGFPACNGWVFMCDSVFAPIDYLCVCAPTLSAENTTVMNRALYDTDMKFYLYLRSLQNKYNLLVPTDEALGYYRDPISWANFLYDGSGTPEIWKFRMYNGDIVADVYASDGDGNIGARPMKVMGLSGDSEGRNKIQNRLRDIMDMHIVVADNEKELLSAYLNDGVQFGLTKGGTVLKVQGSGLNTTFTGGGDINLGLPEANIAESVANPGEKAYYEQNNGRTFFIDRVLQDPFKSVYMTMKENADYEAFFNLLRSDVAENVLEQLETEFKDDDLTGLEAIFDEMTGTSSTGLGLVVSSFNNYRYTVLVPTAAALQEAFDSNPDLWTWERIAAEPDMNKKKEKCLYLLNFLRYHFIDGICPVAGVAFSAREYETAARNLSTKKFVPVNVSGNGTNLTFRAGTNGIEAHVVTSNPESYNVLTRDYIVNGTDRKTATQILASSRAVLHLVDKALDYQK